MKIFVCLSLILGTAFASTYIGDYSNPNYPGKCVIREDLILAPGMFKNPMVDCGRIICGIDGTAEFQDCGVTLIETPGCTVGDYADKTLAYPQCCKRKLVCPDNLELHNTSI